MASVSHTADAHAILRAPDLDSAERAYLGLMPDLEHVNALARRAVACHAWPTRHAAMRCR